MLKHIVVASLLSSVALSGYAVAGPEAGLMSCGPSEVVSGQDIESEPISAGFLPASVRVYACAAGVGAYAGATLP